jgi:hypothetical protein
VEGKDLVGSLSQMSCSDTSLTVRHQTVSVDVTMSVWLTRNPLSLVVAPGPCVFLLVLQLVNFKPWTARACKWLDGPWAGAHMYSMYG